MRIRNTEQNCRYPKNFDPTAIFVNTEDTCRTDFLLRLLSSQRFNLLVTGAAASCKSLNLRQFLLSLDGDKYLSSTVAFSQASAPSSLLDNIFNVIDKRQGRTYGPESGKSCVIVVEDVSLTPSDKYGDQINCELLRQLINEGGFYDIHKPAEWSSVMGLHYICVMAHPLYTHKDIPMRLKGQLCAFNITVPSDGSMNIALTRIFDRHFTKAKAPTNVTKLARMLPEATIALCKSLKQSLVSNDSRIHYTFNLHDTMRVVTGILQCHPLDYPTPEQVIRLWRHECERALSDKLVATEHRVTVLESIQHILQHKSFDDINRDQCLEGEVCFGNFFRTVNGEPIDRYGPLPDIDELDFKLRELQAKETNTYPLYDEAIGMVVRVARLLSMRRGSVILVGLLSSGRAPISRLAAAVANSTCFDPEDVIVKGGGTYMETICEAYRIAGLEARSVTILLFADKMLDDLILDKINQFLLTGNLPGAINRKEFDAIADDLRSLLDDGPTLLTDRQIFAMFERRAWNNMHIILCSRPEDPGFRIIMQRFPNFLSTCQTMWLLPWAGDTLKDVAAIHFKDFPVELTIGADQLSEYAADVHTLIQEKIEEYTAATGRHISVTPRTFLAFIDTFKSIYATQFKVLEDRLQRIQTALKKLRDAGYQVSEMKNELLSRERSLQDAHELTAERLKSISVSTMHAERKKGEVQEAQKKISERAHEIQQARSTLELDLESAKPLMNDAQAALESVSEEDILHLASQKSQPTVVKLVLDAILIVLRHSIRPIEMQDARSYRDSFVFAMEVISAPNCSQRLRGVECDSMNGETAELLAPYLRHKDFNLEKVKSFSAPAAGLASWIQAMARYYDATSVIIPKIMEMDEHELNLEEHYVALAQQQEQFDECRAELDEMHQSFEEAMALQQKLKTEATYTRTKLATSTFLLTGLQEERARWIQETEESRDEGERLPGDGGIAAAMMVYLGPFNPDARAELLQSVSALCHELNIEFSAELHVPKFFTTQNEISSWFVQGLPCDEFSIQNGMLALYCKRFPLLIDPQELCMRWIKTRENPRVISDFTSEAVLSAVVADSLVNGKVLVYEGIENTVNPDLEILFDQTFDPDSAMPDSNTTRRIFWKGKELDWHPNFRIFLFSALSDPHFSADLAGRTTIIDASMTLQGLQDQLLNSVVQKLNPDLESSRLKLLTDINGLRKGMDDHDKTLLNELSESEGNLLDNDQLMTKLTDIKSLLGEVDVKLLEAEDSESDVLRSYEDYRPIAARGALLYFALVSMTHLDKMYQISMTLFDLIFQRSLKWQEEAYSNMTFADKLVVIANDVTYAVLKFYSMCYKLEHRNVFELAVALRLGLTEQQWENPDFLRCLAKCGSGLEISLVQRKPKDWIPDLAWLNLVFLVDKIPRCRSIVDSIVRKETAWKTWFEKDNPEMDVVPEHENLEPIHKLLLIRALREDRIIAASRDFFWVVLGEGLPEDFFSKQSRFDIETVWAWSTSNQPIILLSEKGIDPTAAILSFAKQRSAQCSVVSLGQGTMGEGSSMHTAVCNAIKAGEWVVLQNAHLISATDLEKNLATLSEYIMPPPKPEDESKMKMKGSYQKTQKQPTFDFRIWITAQRWEECPSTLLLRSIRASYQAPNGVRDTLLRAYEENVQANAESVQRDRAWGRQVYSLAATYSIMQQRRKYGSSAWSVAFDLDFPVINTTCKFLKSFVWDSSPDKTTSVGQQQVVRRARFVLGEVLLGGLLEDDWDKRILKTLLESTISEQMFTAGENPQKSDSC